MDVKSAFRQVGVDPPGAVNFGYVLGGYVFIDPRLTLGCRVVEGIGQCHSTKTATDDPGISEDHGGKSGACPGHS